MAHDENPTEPGPADEALAAAARSGDDAAFAELWHRHAAAGSVVARQYAHIADADDLLAEAYARILASFRRGSGPSGAFRPYLYRTIRNLAIDWRRPADLAIEDVAEGDLALEGPELAAAERSLGFRAFRSLPERWQSVLWYLDIEGLDPAEAAPILGLSPNATSALAGRAREGLKKAWLQAHVNDGGVPDGCRWTTDRMGEYARGGLTRRGRERFTQHLDACGRCRALLAEVEDAGGRLAALLLPFLVGGSTGAALLADRSVTSTPAASPARPALLAAGAGIVVAAVAATALAFGLPADDRRVPVTHPTPTTSPDPTPDPAPDPAPDPTPDPTPAVTPEPTPPRAAPPVAPPVIPPPAVAPAVPAAPVIVDDPVTGRIVVTGAGDVPGATIEVWGTTTSLVTSVTSPATLLATAVVAPDGTWSTSDAGGLTPLNVTVTVRQVNDGVPSDSVVLTSGSFFAARVESNAGTVAGGTVSWTITGWAGAAWEIRESGGGPVVSSGVIAADGTALAVVTLPAGPSGAVVAFDYGYVQDGITFDSSPGLTATLP